MAILKRKPEPKTAPKQTASKTHGPVGKDGLTTRQRKFCEEFMRNGGSRVEAARAAGYSHPNAAMRSKAVQDYIQQHQEEVAREAAERAGVKQEYVINRLKAIVERCMQAEPVMDADGNPTGEYKFDATPAIRALDLLGRHLGLWEAPEKGKSQPTPVHLYFSRAAAAESGAVDLSQEKAASEHIRDNATRLN